jgi:hypothetical protein
MRFFYLHPDDLRWLSRWLRNNLLCIVAIMCFLMMIRLLTSAPATTVAHCKVVASSDRTQQCEPLTADGQFRAVAPEGWRLTNRGWEDVSTWPPLPRSLGEIVIGQRASEPAWLQLTLAKLRGVPPLIFALLQLTAITAIVNTSRSDNQA